MLAGINVYFKTTLGEELSFTYYTGLGLDIAGYIISENIKLLRIITPIAGLGVIVSTMGTVFNILSRAIPSFYLYYTYCAEIYYVGFNVYILLSFCLYIHRDTEYKRRFCRKVIPQKSQTVFVMNDNFLKQQTSEEHFRIIKQEWRVVN
ncbi:hypothetical protein FO519_008234 [Halicephalobus sp. NKZ332]|nr:hypothetical protein FO519_008234 [Halicephalobus sp. NKZ332]